MEERIPWWQAAEKKSVRRAVEKTRGGKVKKPTFPMSPYGDIINVARHQKAPESRAVLSQLADTCLVSALAVVLKAVLVEYYSSSTAALISSSTARRKREVLPATLF
jgi:hypothetical protein